MRLHSLAALLLVSTASAALAQDPAEGTLYTRTEDGVVRAAVVIELDYGWHLYHDELGHPEAVGKPTKVTLSGAGVKWSPVRFPEPIELDQSIFGEGVFILAHEDVVHLFAAGRLPAGVETVAVSAEVDGLVCEDLCVPYRARLADAGRGPDEVWADFPADLTAPEAAPTKDVRGGEADATLYTRVVEGKVQVALEIDVEDGWHLYHSEKGNPKGVGKPTRIQLLGDDVAWGAFTWPEPHEIDQSDIIAGAWIWGHDGRIVVYAEGTPSAPGPHTIWAKLSGQTCTEETCLPYAETVIDRGAGPADVWSGFPEPAEEGGGGERGTEGESSHGAPAPAAGERGAERDSTRPPGVTAASVAEFGGPVKEEIPLGAFLLEAVLWGLVTLLMPCTYPMIPITISFFTKQADARGGKVLPLAFAYGAGIVLIFVAIGVVVGPVIVLYAQHPVTNIVIGVLFFVFALVLFGLVTIEPPRFLMNLAGKASSMGGLVGVFLMGTTLVVTSFTCTAPFVGTLLARGAAGGDLARVVLGMSVFGLTMAIPFVVLSLVPNVLRTMPRSGSWMNTLKVTLGFVELAAAFKFFSNSDLGWSWNVISREFFLALWAAIFLVAALYLFGLFRRGGAKPGRIQIGFAALLAVFAGYCGWGMVGNRMDFVMTAMVPPYSGGHLFPMWYEFGGEWALVKDDYERAREEALASDKLVFVNFTGFT